MSAPAPPPSTPDSPNPANQRGSVPVFAAPPVQTLRVVARQGGLMALFTGIFGLVTLAVVFGSGLGIGILFMLAGSSVETRVIRSVLRDGTSSRQIVVIPVETIIDSYAAFAARNAVDWTLEQGNVAAVVLRVDSPGGGVSASDEIWYEIERLKNARIPVVASYGGVAASGGYYISCAADHIVAEPTCTTGSIGVIAQVLTFEGLLDKVGVESITLVASDSPNKNVANDTFRSWNENDRQKVVEMLNSAYNIFLDRVKKGRASVISDESQIEALADGSVFDAATAQSNGLIDSIGYLDDAIAKAEKLAGTPRGSATVVRVDAPVTLFDMFGVQSRTRVRSGTKLSNLDAEHLRSFVNELSAPRMMYLMR